MVIKCLFIDKSSDGWLTHISFLIRRRGRLYWVYENSIGFYSDKLDNLIEACKKHFEQYPIIVYNRQMGSWEKYVHEEYERALNEGICFSESESR